LTTHSVDAQPTAVLADGHFAYTGSPLCPSPLATFDPINATSAELQFYGLPFRPHGNAQALAQWTDMVRHAKHRVCGSTISGNAYAGSKQSRPTSLQIGKIGNAFASPGIWAGVVATDGGFDWVFSD